MKIKTKPYGEIEVNEKQKLHFSEGIIGFEEISHYYLIDSKEGPFYWLQAAEEPELAFLLVDPRIFMNNYKLEVKKSDLASLNLDSNDDLLDFTIITVPEDHLKISVNLMGPIVINRKTREAKQVISENDEYTVKHYIIEEIKKQKEKLVEKEDARSYTAAQ
ncbi:MAG: flagellar assembly protein FliW [Spirochaetes bacterium]|nr:flagellar assembly protein FliW [Spirochaetota bacterium]